MGNQWSSKRIILEYRDNNFAYVDVSYRDTLHDVRETITKTFDADMIPDHNNYCFNMDGVRVSRKQEKTINVYRLEKHLSIESIDRLENESSKRSRHHMDVIDELLTNAAEQLKDYDESEADQSTVNKYDSLGQSVNEALKEQSDDSSELEEDSSEESCCSYDEESSSGPTPDEIFFDCRRKSFSSANLSEFSKNSASSSSEAPASSSSEAKPRIKKILTIDSSDDDDEGLMTQLPLITPEKD